MASSADVEVLERVWDGRTLMNAIREGYSNWIHPMPRGLFKTIIESKVKECTRSTKKAVYDVFLVIMELQSNTHTKLNKLVIDRTM